MTKTKKPTAKQLFKLKDEIITFLCNKDLWFDVQIFVNNNMYTDHDKNGHYPNDPNKIVEKKNVDPKDYIEYTGEDLLCMTFEGPLYEELNYGIGKTEEQLNAIFKKYGLYYEMGYAWSLAAAVI